MAFGHSGAALQSSSPPSDSSPPSAPSLSSSPPGASSPPPLSTATTTSTSTADDEASSLAPAAASADDDVSTAHTEQGDAESAKKEGWARKLEERQKQLREVSDRLRAAKREYDQEQHRSIRRHKTEADRELEQSFSADAKARKRARLEALRHQRLAKLREGWLAELARRKKRDDEARQQAAAASVKAEPPRPNGGSVIASRTSGYARWLWPVLLQFSIFCC